MVLMLALCHAVEATRQRSHRLGGYVRSTSDGRVLHIAATLQAGARRAALGGSPDVQARLCSCWRSDHASHGLRAVGVNPPVTRHPSYDCLEGGREGGREGVRSAFYIHFDALACSALLKARLTIYGTAWKKGPICYDSTGSCSSSDGRFLAAPALPVATDECLWALPAGRPRVSGRKLSQ